MRAPADAPTDLIRTVAAWISPGGAVELEVSSLRSPSSELLPWRSLLEALAVDIGSHGRALPSCIGGADRCGDSGLPHHVLQLHAARPGDATVVSAQQSCWAETERATFRAHIRRRATHPPDVWTDADHHGLAACVAAAVELDPKSTEADRSWSGDVIVTLNSRDATPPSR